MDMLRLVVAACCDMGWISTERGVLCDRSVSKNTVSIILMHKVVTLNTCCDIACLTFQLPHNITGFFSEPPTTTHNWLFSEPPSPTFERTQQTFSQIRKSCAVHKLVWWHSHMVWASGLEFVFFWDNINNQKYVRTILLKMTFFWFPNVKWLHLTGEVDKFVRFSRQSFSGLRKFDRNSDAKSNNNRLILTKLFRK